MSFKKLAIPDVILFKPNVFQDDRGFFQESYNQKYFNEVIGKQINFFQDNLSFSNKYVLRGIHFQMDPSAQGKLVRVASGKVFDIAVDLRVNSPTYGEWVGEILSGENYKQLWIPEGFGHAFLSMEDHTHFLYKTTNPYDPKSESSIAWNDQDLNIKWPLNDVDNFIVNDKDARALTFRETKGNHFK